MKDYGKTIPGGFFSEEQHLYRNEQGMIVPSTTQIFSILGMNDFSGVPEDVLEWKRRYGSALHASVEFLLSNDLNWDTVDEQIIPALTGIEMKLKEVGYEPITLEQPMVYTYNGMQYGLTSDGTGTMMYRGERRHVVIDYKTGAKFSPTWVWQVGSYGLPQPKVPKGWMGLVLQVDKLGNVEPHYVDMYKAQKEWSILLAAGILKLNAGLAKVG